MKKIDNLMKFEFDLEEWLEIMKKYLRQIIHQN